MEFIINIFLWIFNLSTENLTLLFIGVLSFLFAVMCLLAYLKKETLLEHFDNYTVQYITILSLIVPFFMFTLIFKISPMIVIFIMLIIISTLRIIGYRSRYSEYNLISAENTTINNNFLPNILSRNRETRIKRRISLKKAAAFIKPYKNIMGKLILSNKYCQLTYQRNTDYTFEYSCISKKRNFKNEYEFFETISTKAPEWNNDFFNSICINFEYNTSFLTLYSLFEQNEFVFLKTNYSKPDVVKKDNAQNQLDAVQKKILTKIKHKEKEEEIKNLPKININDATEADFTALPGINIIQAKKIIKYRNSNGDFKSLDEFIEYIKIKPHFINQIRNRVTVESTIIKLNLKNCIADERIVDFD